MLRDPGTGDPGPSRAPFCPRGPGHWDVGGLRLVELETRDPGPPCTPFGQCGVGGGEDAGVWPGWG